ncbi:porin family protein [Rufibacter roseolus]|uniref:porin family protein n=1 Tax=Rufibacter roseolus TaxID=2817375 RepID=UPI001B31145E|nr:porin family protein [Rufibacter roseolus]
MKKAVLLFSSVIALNVFTIHVASAQSSKFWNNINFGVKAGFNWTSSNDEDRVSDNKVNPRPGFHVGGLAHYHLTDKWALQTELMYSKEGALYDFPGSATIAPYEGKTDLNFINMPFLVQYMILSGLRIQTGVQIGLVKSAKYEDPYNDEFEKDDIQKGNVSWTIGFGYLTKSGLGFDARYNGGLSNMYKEGFYPGQSARTRAGQIGFFYQFK